MDHTRLRCTVPGRRGRAVSLLLALLIAGGPLQLHTPSPAAAGTASVTWDSRADFETNASTTGQTTTRSGLSTARVPGSVTLSGVSEALSAGVYHTVGLKSDGTVVAVGDNLYGQCNVSGWTDIVALSAGYYHTVGLRSDGTVVAVGWNAYGECNVSGWTDIVAISAGGVHTVGLRSDGTVVASGWNDNGQCNVSGWTDIVALSAGGFHTAGLRRDDTVVAVGWNAYGECNVSGWTDIVALSAAGSHTVGLRRDGTVVAVGDNWYGQCDVSGWTSVGLGARSGAIGGTGSAVGLRAFADEPGFRAWSGLAAQISALRPHGSVKIAVRVSGDGIAWSEPLGHDGQAIDWTSGSGNYFGSAYGDFAWQGDLSQVPRERYIDLEVRLSSGGVSTPELLSLTLTSERISAPVALADDYTTAKNVALTVAAGEGVLANDSDADGDPITAVLVGDVTSGTLALEEDGSFVYTPAAGFTGEVTFTYKATDGAAESELVTVTIAVTNTAPVAAGETYTTSQGSTLSVAAPGVLANDSDADGDTLAVADRTDPASGTVTLNADGSFVYRPAPGFAGQDSFTYKVTDGLSVSAPATVIIKVSAVGELSGTSRYDTAIAVSREGFVSGECTAVILATGRNFPDALGAAALAGVRDCPILLVDGKGTFLPASVRDEIRRLTKGRGSFDVYIMGGTLAVSKAVEDSLKASLTGERVIRVAGATRYDTAIECAKKARDAAGRPLTGAFVVTGRSFADALLAGPVAFAYDRPVLITDNSAAVNAKVRSALTYLGSTSISVVGSPASVSDATLVTLGPGATRVASAADPYAQSVAVAEWATGAGLLSWSGAGIATGQNHADALGAAPFLGRKGAPLLLTQSATLPSVVRDAIAARKTDIGKITYFGGSIAIKPEVRAAVAAAMQ